jgi:trehalose/maltose hydrolase-like predicted phosphorylase
VDTRENSSVHLSPRLPQQIKEVTFNVRYQGQWLYFTVSHTKVVVTLDSDYNSPVCLKYENETYEVQPGVATAIQIKKD